VDRDEITRVLRAFQTAGVEYVLIGAAAIGFHGLVRATQDLDLFIRATAARTRLLGHKGGRQAYPKTTSTSGIVHVKVTLLSCVETFQDWLS